MSKSVAFNSCGSTRPFAHSETARGKSLWIHQKEQKNNPWRFPNQVVGFSLGLSNHQSSSTNRVEEKVKSGNRSKCWAHFCRFLWCCAEIAARYVPNSKHVASNMANFWGSQWVYFTCLCSKYPLVRFLLVWHSFLTGYFRPQASHTFRNLRSPPWRIKFPAKYRQVKSWPWVIIYNVTGELKLTRNPNRSQPRAITHWVTSGTRRV